MRPKTRPLAFALFALASLASSQEPRFERLHESVDTSSREVNGAVNGYRRTVVVDIDGDRDRDIITVTQDPFLNLRILRADGLGGFRREPFPLLLPTAQEIRAGDLDGDSDMDLVLDASTGFFLLYNDGTGQFTIDNSGLPALPSSARLRVGDITGDGRVDLYAIEGDGEYDILLVNQGDRVFEVETGRVPFFLRPAPFYTELVDFDGDGDLDVLRLDFGLTPLDRYLRNDSGTLRRQPLDLLDTPIGVGDLSGNGTPDILTSAGEILVQDAAGDVQTIDALASFGRTGDVVDLNDDGLDDIVWVRGLGELEIYLNRGGFVFTPPVVFDDTEEILHVDVFDADRDGDPDLFLTAFPQNRLLLGRGDGSFVDVSSEAPDGGTRATTIELGDVDGDGAPDLVSTHTAQPITLRRNDGTGTFGGAQVVFDSGTFPSLEDYDGDGDLDLFTGNALVDVLDNDGRGNFTELQDVFAGVDSYQEVFARDFDQDGDRDVLFVRTSSGRRWFLQANDGTGQFEDRSDSLQPGIRPELLPASTRRMLLGDVTGDGRLDFVRIGSSSSTLLAGSSGPTLFQPLANPLPLGIDGALLDADGDGDLDLAVVSATGTIWINDGSGNFTPDPARWTPAPGPLAPITAGDFDGDGRGDLVSGRNLAWWNDGTNLVAIDLPRYRIDDDLPFVGRAPTIMDLDRDGDGDIVITGYPRLHFNTATQLARASVARPGRSLRYEVFGPANTQAFLFGSTRTLSSPIATGAGLFHLQPQGLVGLGSTSLDGEGRGELALDVPANTALLGQELHTQAFYPSLPRFSNLETVTVGDL